MADNTNGHITLVEDLWPFCIQTHVSWNFACLPVDSFLVWVPIKKTTQGRPNGCQTCTSRGHY